MSDEQKKTEEEKKAPSPDLSPEASAKGEGCEGGVCRRPETIADYTKKLEELTNQYLRAMADYQNLQKEVARERAEMGQYATLRVVERFLPVFDNFNVAMSHMPKSDDKAVVNWAMGVGFIQKQIEGAMKDLGLTPIKTVGEKFDAAKHEAVGEEPGDSGQASGLIIKEVQPGYEVMGRVVRPAKVITAK